MSPMREATVTRPLSALDRAVLGCIVYSDVFDFPVAADEVWRALPQPASLQQVEAALAGLDGLVRSAPPYYALSGREQLVALRERRRESSRELRRCAERYGRVIGRLPFVRMVALTGSLAVENADAGDDLDYLIVTERGRVWLTRTLIMAVVRLAGLRGVTVCPNYILAESALALPERDYYTARELLQMTPLCGGSVYQRMLAENAWWRDFLPNASPFKAAQSSVRPEAPEERTHHAADVGGFSPRSLAEAALRTPVGSLLERWLLRRKARELSSQADAGDETAFDADVCKGHFEGYRRLTRERVESRMRALLGEDEV
jgi:hypothetical protein